MDFSKFYFIKTLMRMLFQQIRMGIWRRKSTMKTLTLIKQSFSTRHLKKVSLRKYFDNAFTAEVPCFIKNTFFITKPRIALSKKLCDYRHYGKMHQAKGAEELNQAQSVGTCIETCLSFPLCASNSDNLGPVARSMVSVNQRLIPWQRIGFDTA